MHTISDCFGGADGGIAFIKLCGMIRRLEEEALQGLAAATQLLTLIHQFGKLIEAAQHAQRPNPPPAS